MGLNLAIIIGIKDYDKQQQLVACQKDARNMNTLLKATSKYDDILLLDSDRIECDTLKNEIPSFVSKYEGKDIDEVFLYYSGHGGLYGEEFIYIPSDYDSSKPNLTSYKNSEVDDLLRRLSPKLAVKVIDACQSGEHYVKDVDQYEKSLHSTKGRFQNCYFMFSSHDYQSSETDMDMGFFTRAWFDAINYCKNTNVKYRHITDFIADSFQTNKSQIPYFVTQGTSLEEFCCKTKEVVDAINNILTGKSAATDTKANATSPLVAAIQADAENYRTDDQICKILEGLKLQIESISLKGDLASVFKVQFSFINGLNDFRHRSEVGEWLKKKGKNTYKATYEQKEILEPNGLFQPLGEQKPVEQLFKYLPSYPNYYVSGFSVNIQLPYNVIKIDFISEYPNVGNYSGIITFVPSPTDMRFFYYLTRSNGTTPIRNQTLASLATISCLFKNENNVEDGMGLILTKFQDSIIEDLNTQFLDASTGGTTSA